MTTTTSTPAESITVSATVWDQYNRVNGGEKAAAVAKDLGITGSTVSANVRRVKAALEAGKSVNVDGDTAATGTGTAPAKVDRIGIAEGIRTGASLFVREVDRLTGEVDRIDARMATLVKDRAAMAAQIDGVRAMAESAGFDFAAYDKAVADATPSDPPSDDKKDEDGSSEDKAS